MRAPVRAIRGRWPASWERRARRLFRVDPRVLLQPSASSSDVHEAMSILHVGHTIKITGSGRHAKADDLLVQHVSLDGATIADIGASDGTTSVELARKVSTYGAYVIADLYLEVTAVRLGARVLFFDPDGRCILVAGRRLLAWPSLSRFVHAAVLPLLLASRGRPRETVLLLGPDARELLREDPRVSTRVHDVFTVWQGPRPDVIKVANLLRRLYFSDVDILRALRALLDSLDEGGHLLVVDNPRITGVSERAGLYRRAGERFVSVAETENPPEIADLLSSDRFVLG